MPIGGGGFGEGGFGEQGFGPPSPPPSGYFSLVQSAIAGPAPIASFTLSYGINVTAGNLLVVVAFEGSNTDTGVSVTCSDDQGNVWNRDAFSTDNVLGAIFSAVAVSTGRPTVTVSFSSSSVLGAGIAILEIQKPISPLLDTTSVAAEHVTGAGCFTSLTTGHDAEVVIALGVGFASSFSGAGWNSLYNWGAAGGLAAQVLYQVADTIGTTVAATESGITPGQTCLLLAAYRLSTARIFNESISFGVQAAASPAAGVSFSGVLSMGMQGATADGASSSFQAPAVMGAALGDSSTVAATLRDSLSFGAAAATVPQVLAQIQQALVLGIGAGFSDSAIASLAGQASLGISAASLSSVQAILRDAITLRIAAGELTIPQATFRDSAIFGASAGLVSDIQAVIAGAIASGILAAFSASGAGTTIYNDSVGLGVAAATSAGAALASALSISFAASIGSASAVSATIAERALLAALLGEQGSVILQSAAGIGLGIGAHVSANPAAVFRDQVALAAFAAALAHFITPATVRVLAVPLIERSFTADPSHVRISVPALRRSFLGNEKAMIYATKHPGSTEDFSIDLSPLAVDTSIVSISVPAVPGITIQDQGATLPLAVVRIGGGTSGQAYLVSVLATLASGEIKVQNLTLSVALVPGIVNATQVPVDKDPRSREKFELLWSPLTGSDPITGSSWSSALVPLTNESFDTISAGAWLGAAAAGTYPITNTVTTAGGQTKACDLFLIVQPI